MTKVESIIEELSDQEKQLLMDQTDLFQAQNGKHIQAEIRFMFKEEIDIPSFVQELKDSIYPQFYNEKKQRIWDNHAILFDDDMESYYATFSPMYRATFQYASQTYTSIDDYMTRQYEAIQGYAWDRVKERILFRGLRAQFAQHPEMRTILLATGASILGYMVEKDQWATSKHIGDADAFSYLEWPTSNLYGRILSQVREELRHWQEASSNVCEPSQPLPYVDACDLPANAYWQKSIEELYKNETLQPILDAYFLTLRPGFGISLDQIQRYSLFTIESSPAFPKEGLMELKQDLYDMVLYGAI